MQKGQPRRGTEKQGPSVCGPRSKRCIYCAEEFALHHPDPIGYLDAHRALWQDSVIILRDMFCGVVPCSPEERAWRQKTGRLAQYLGREAERVSRIFCGLEQRLK